MGPVVRRPVRELEYHLLRAAANAAAAARPAKLARRPAVGAAERVVETAAAAETGRHRDLRDRQAGLGQQAHREMQAARLRDRDRGGAHVAGEQSHQVARADPEPPRERLDRSFIERAVVDQPQRAAHHRSGPEPSGCAGRGLRATAQAWPESRRLGGRGGAEEAHVGALGVARGTDRPAVDAGRGHGDVKLAVEAGIAADAGAVQRLRVESRNALHGAQHSAGAAARVAIFGPGGPCPARAACIRQPRHAAAWRAAPRGARSSCSIPARVRRARRPIRSSPGGTSSRCDRCAPSA